MDFRRNELNEFHYSTTLDKGVSRLMVIGTSDIANREIRITDLKMTTPSAVKVDMYVSSYTSYSDRLRLCVPADNVISLSWEMPFRLFVQASTIETRAFVASTDDAGIRLAISGYIDKK